MPVRSGSSCTCYRDENTESFLAARHFEFLNAILNPVHEKARYCKTRYSYYLSMDEFKSVEKFGKRADTNSFETRKCK